MVLFKDRQLLRHQVKNDVPGLLQRRGYDYVGGVRQGGAYLGDLYAAFCFIVTVIHRLPDTVSSSTGAFPVRRRQTSLYLRSILNKVLPIAASLLPKESVWADPG